ncbi:YdcH family protein [Paracoccus acridae]|uniref:YdcH family protein n=1 Tax=Paracoccus acridae TaxID=1795310 RepID=UPI0034D77E72
MNARHAALEDQLAELLKRPSAGAEEIAAIKKEKLEIKDELALLQRETAET